MLSRKADRMNTATSRRRPPFQSSGRSAGISSKCRDSSAKPMSRRLRRSGWLLPIASCRRRPAARVHYSPEHHDAGLPQFKKLLGVRKPEPTRWLECLGNICNLAGGADAERLTATNGHEIIQVSADH